MPMSDNDFKYYLDSLTVLSLGARYTYAELIREENISLKYRSVCRRYLTAQVDPATTLESHFYYMEPGDECCDIYTQLKTKVLVLEPQDKGSRAGTPSYKERVYKVQELAAIPPKEKEARGMVIREIQISKMGLAGFAL